MKKNFLLIALLMVTVSAFSQRFVTIDLGEEVYDFISMAEEKGYCSRTSNLKPYTEDYILDVLSEIKETLESKEESRITKTELESVDFYLSRYERKTGIDYSKLALRFESADSNLPVSFEYNTTMDGFLSSGFYKDSDLNSTGYEGSVNFNFLGDLGNYVSYRSTGYMLLTEMPLQTVGEDYSIGYWWYDDWLQNGKNKNKNKDKLLQRTINTYRNNSVLPYSYTKKWDGSVYYLSNVSASGLEGWPIVPSLGFGMYGDIRASFFDNRLELGIARVNREWAGMDKGSSLVLNENAAPFVGADLNFKLFDWFSFSTMTGFLEFPNASYVNSNAWYRVTTVPVVDANGDPVLDENGKQKYTTIEDKTIDRIVDSYFFQNIFSIAMLSGDFKYLHLDCGSTCIWPKRFELGYMFPMVNHVVYQNSVGDFDNLALFGDIKGILPGVGSAWFSLFLDELNEFSAKFWEKTRCMYSWQGGAKVNIPWLPFTTLSARYTKVEPYCYTHQAIRKQPWYDGYLSESYTNNGRSLGYYLEPNSDEVFIRLESKPVTAATFGLQYQMVRHGADYGSGAVRGSSIWSELPTGNRNIYYKYFLHDGTYEWTHVVKFDASYNLQKHKLPVQLNGGIGYVYDYFTQSEGGADKNTPYHKIDTAEYPVKQGFVMYMGFKAFAFEHCK